MNICCIFPLKNINEIKKAQQLIIGLLGQSYFMKRFI